MDSQVTYPVMSYVVSLVLILGYAATILYRLYR